MPRGERENKARQDDLHDLGGSHRAIIPASERLSTPDGAGERGGKRPSISAYGEVRVAAARVGQDEHARALEPLALETALKRVPAGTAFFEHRAVQRDADEGDDWRLQAADLAAKHALAVDVFLAASACRCRACTAESGS